MRGIGWYLALAVGLPILDSTIAADPEFRPIPRHPTIRLELPPAASFHFESAGISISTLARDAAGRARALFGSPPSSRPSDGGGGSVENGLVFQSRFLDSDCPPTNATPACESVPCTAVTFVWEEPSPNLGGLDLLVNDQLLGQIPPLEPGIAPPVNGVEIWGLPAGSWILRVEAPDGSYVEGRILVLDNQPFADPRSVMCSQAEAPGCVLRITIEGTGGALPDEYGISVDGQLIEFEPSSITEAIIHDLEPGEHCVSVVGLLQTEAGLYRGCFRESCCELFCDDLPCAPPRDLLLCQNTYGDEPTNSVRVSWLNGTSSYESIAGLVDGQEVTRFDGSLEIASVGGLAIGTRRIGLEADCGAKGVAETVESLIEVRSESPHSTPVEGELSCNFEMTPEGPRTVVSWTNLTPSRFVDVFVIVGADAFFLGTLPGGSQEAIVTGTTRHDAIVLQFFSDFDGFCYGSPLFACAPESASVDHYLPGACDGGSELNLTSAIFLLNFLFLGGERPPCLQACDCSGNGTIDLSDAICDLNFLFLGGTAPSGWERGQPSCVEIREEDDCDAPSPACPD